MAGGGKVDSKRSEWGHLEEDDATSGLVGVQEDDDLRMLAEVLLQELAAGSLPQRVSVEELYALMTQRYTGVRMEDFEEELLALCEKLHLRMEEGLPLGHNAQAALFEELDSEERGAVGLRDIYAAMEALGTQVSEEEIEAALAALLERRGEGMGDPMAATNSSVVWGGERDTEVAVKQDRSGIHSILAADQRLVNFEQFRELLRSLPMVSSQQFYVDLVEALSVESESATAATMWMALPAEHKWPYFVAGGLGGLAAKIVTAPLDRVKILAQTTVQKASTTALASRIWAQEGVRGFYRGSLASMIRTIPFSAVVCGVYTIALERLPSHAPLLPNEPGWRLIAGAMAGATATVVSFPLDVARARMSIMAADGQQGYLPLREVLRNMARHPGTALYGLKPALWALAPFIAIQQASYDVMKYAALSVAPPSVPLFLGCGAVAGVTAQAIVYPFDLLRRRMQVSAHRY